MSTCGTNLNYSSQDPRPRQLNPPHKPSGSTLGHLRHPVTAGCISIYPDSVPWPIRRKTSGQWTGANWLLSRVKFASLMTSACVRDRFLTNVSNGMAPVIWMTLICYHSQCLQSESINNDCYASKTSPPPITKSSFISETYCNRVGATWFVGISLNTWGSLMNIYKVQVTIFLQTS